MASLLRILASGCEQAEVLANCSGHFCGNNNRLGLHRATLGNRVLRHRAPYPVVLIATIASTLRALNISLYIRLGENKYKHWCREMFAELWREWQGKESEPDPAELTVVWLLLPRCVGILLFGHVAVKTQFADRLYHLATELAEHRVA